MQVKLSFNLIREQERLKQYVTWFFAVKGCTTAPDHRAIGNSRYGNLRTFSDQRSCGVAASQGAARGERRHDGEADEAAHLSTKFDGDFRSGRVDQKVSIDVEPQV
nr:hypothetical protein [Paenibacillus phytorum]